MKTITLLPLTLLFAASACASKSADTPPPAPAEPPAAEPAETNDYPDKDPDKSSIVLDPAVAALCEIPTAHFDYDKSNLSAEAQAALDALAACFLEGPAMGKGMKLVGHADPRGTEDYNLALGHRRSGSVAGYLGGQGLGNARLETSSRGELDAMGTDEDTWVRDRKVEIFLAE